MTKLTAKWHRPDEFDHAHYIFPNKMSGWNKHLKKMQSVEQRRNNRALIEEALHELEVAEWEDEEEMYREMDLNIEAQWNEETAEEQRELNHILEVDPDYDVYRYWNGAYDKWCERRGL